MIAKTEVSGDVKTVQKLESVTVRFCGDSGDGMQLAGTQFTNTSALFGNDVSTLPDFPAEIRAPVGTLAGVSGFQIRFSSAEIFTPGDEVDLLIAMNPAALKTNLNDLTKKGVLVVNQDEFSATNLKKAGYESNPLEDGSLKAYQLHAVKITSMNKQALDGSGLSAKQVDRCKNFFALGLVYWLYGRSMKPTLEWITQKFAKVVDIAEANTKALKAGYFFGETTETFAIRYEVPQAKIAPGRYRKIMGSEALALGFVTAAKLAKTQLFLGSYPITPASSFQEELNRYKNFGVKTFQAEDEIAAITSVIGASFAGAIALTCTSGPGLALKGEALGLAVIMELPMVVINVQRGGPSTGLPTKTEQSDLNIALYGRHGECPMPVIAAKSPGDCFDTAIEAVRIAVKYMTPVILLSDGYLTNGSEPWKIPKFDTLEEIKVAHPKADNGQVGFLPYKRDDNLARPWALPGTPGLEHRLGGLEKEDITGDVCYDPDNHQHMTDIRAQKVAGIAQDIPPTEISGDSQGELLVVGWGGTYGAITQAVQACQANGMPVSSIHLRHLNPLPDDLGSILDSFDKILIPEINTGQLRMLLRAKYLLDIQGLNKVKGKPFLTKEIVDKISSMILEEVKV